MNGNKVLGKSNREACHIMKESDMLVISSDRVAGVNLCKFH